MTTNVQAHAQTREHDAMKPQPKWQDGSILILAGILFISPWVFGTVTQTSSSWNAWIVAIGFVFLTLRTFVPPAGAYSKKCEREGVRMAWWQKILDVCEVWHMAAEELVVGAWLLVAPWILGFAAIGAAARMAWSVGTVTMVLAVWKLRELRDC